jgi:uncharacterized DUF497 family protein
MIGEALSGFDWDQGNREKCQKHGVSIAEIEAVFQGTPSVYADPDHSIDEQRLRAIGRTDQGRYVLVALTFRRIGGATFIRPISARYMHRKEIDRYGGRKA